MKGLKESQFNWRPDPQSWSMAECLLHLNIVGDRYVHAIEKVLGGQAQTRGLTSQGPFTHGRLGQWILANTEPPPKRRSKAPRATTPAYGQPLTAVMPTFMHLQEQLSLQVAQANGLDLARIQDPRLRVSVPMKFNVYLTFAFIAAHERRHLWQARQVRSQAAFPVGR